MQKIIFVFCFIFLFVGAAPAQMIQDPTQWRYEVKKISTTECQLIFHLTIKKGWHIWSLHPGGDGYQIAPSFTFANNTKITLLGSVEEKGKPITTKMDGIEGAITYFSDKVDYVQRVKVAGTTSITGKLNYQVCNDNMCLPPKDKSFTFIVK